MLYIFRRLVLSLVWLGAVSSLFIDMGALRALTTSLLIIFLALSAGSIRRESWVVAGGIALAAIVVLFLGGSWAQLWHGFERALIFAGLLPTLQLTRAIAWRLPKVAKARADLGTLPERSADIGLMFGAQAFGYVLSTGAFAMVSSLVAAQAPMARRLAAGAASLRGMSTSILWSPFFVAFAVASSYLPAVPAWQVFALGFVLMAMALLISILMFARPLQLAAIGQALKCLLPVLAYLLIAVAAVMVVSAFAGLSTLGSVLVTMPLLVTVQLLFRPVIALDVVRETVRGFDRLGDDLLLITASMGLATAVVATAQIADQLSFLVALEIPATVVIAGMLLIQLLPAMAGVHPIITATVVLAAFTSQPLNVHPLILFQAMVAGWSLGTMVSMSAISVVTTANMFNLAPLQLAYGRNLGYALVTAAAVVAVLSALNTALSPA